MEEYLKTLLEQIRCKKARSLIEEELRGHLEEQIEENRMSGMEPEEAEKAAVLGGCRRGPCGLAALLDARAHIRGGFGARRGQMGYHSTAAGALSDYIPSKDA